MLRQNLAHTAKINYLMCAGKSGGGHKAKNAKKQSEPVDNFTGAKSKKNPKKATAMEVDSDDELGQHLLTSSNKFRSNTNSQIRSMLKTDKLLPEAVSSLSQDFYKLVLHSVSSQTWAKHCSAWKLYKEFCNCFGTAFVLPVTTVCQSFCNMGSLR